MCIYFDVIFEIFYISQGSVATQLRYSGIFNNHFIANRPPSVKVKEFRKSDSIWRRYGQWLSGKFFWDTVNKVPWHDTDYLISHICFQSSRNHHLFITISSDFADKQTQTNRLQRWRVTSFSQRMIALFLRLKFFTDSVTESFIKNFTKPKKCLYDGHIRSFNSPETYSQ